MIVARSPIHGLTDAHGMHLGICKGLPCRVFIKAYGDHRLLGPNLRVKVSMQLPCINKTSNTQPLQENVLPKEVFVQSWHPPPVDVATPEQANIRADLHLLPCYLSKRVCFFPPGKKKHWPNINMAHMA